MQYILELQHIYINFIVAWLYMILDLYSMTYNGG